LYPLSACVLLSPLSTFTSHFAPSFHFLSSFCPPSLIPSFILPVSLLLVVSFSPLLRSFLPLPLSTFISFSASPFPSELLSLHFRFHKCSQFADPSMPNS
jgi:hypothetical protein